MKATISLPTSPLAPTYSWDYIKKNDGLYTYSKDNYQGKSGEVVFISVDGAVLTNNAVKDCFWNAKDAEGSFREFQYIPFTGSVTLEN